LPGRRCAAWADWARVVLDVNYTSSSAIAERPRCRVVKFCQKWKTGTGRRYYFEDITGLSSTTVT